MQLPRRNENYEAVISDLESAPRFPLNAPADASTK